MSRRVALLIGVPDERLHGVEGDLERMEEALALHGFTSERLYGAAATRDGILGALARLASRIEPGDAAVIYFSGHGAEARNPRARLDVPAGQPREPAFHRCLVAADLRASTRDDFRGVLSIELDACVAAIADRSENVAVILDCCHSEGITRGDEGDANDLSLGTPEEPGVRAYTLGAPWLAPITALRGSLRAAGIEPDDLAAEADPRVIRLVACGPREIARETVDARGRCGLMTAHLAAVLCELAGRTTPWLAVGREVRERVHRVRGRQHVVLKGPASRLLFRLEEAPTRRVLPVLGRDRPTRVGGGAMAGIEPGDRLLLTGLADEDGVVATALVGRCWAASVELAAEPLVPVDGEHPPIAAASAIPQRYVRPRGHVRLRASAAIEALLERCLPASRVVAVADASTPNHPVAVVAEVAGLLTICDGDGAPLRAPIDLDAPLEGILEAALAYVAETTEALALARALLDLEPPAAGLSLDRARVQWSIRTTIGERSLLHSPAFCTANAPLRLGPGARLVVSVRDAQAKMEPIFAWIFFVCPSGQVTLLSERSPWGAPVGSDEPYVLGERRAGLSEGIEVTAADVVPRGGASRGWLVLIAADGQADLRAWERRVSAFRSGDPLRRSRVARDLEGVDPEPPPGLATRFAVWRVPVELGAAP